MAQNNGQKRIQTIIASRPGVMRQSLLAFIKSYGGVAVVASAGDGLTAFNQVLQYRPGLLLIDSNLLDEEVEALLAAVKAKAPATRCLIIVQSNRQEASLLAAGADGVILRDSSSQQLQETLFRLTRPTLL